MQASSGNLFELLLQVIYKYPTAVGEWVITILIL